MATQTVPQTERPQEREELISGSEAIAIACSLADVDVITAYPIRPYDTVMQYVSKLKADGAFDCDFIVAESEHSQFEIVKHASAVGARTFCGSSGVGWFYAFEAITVTAGLRLPVVAMVGNRALDDPGAFGVEHNDAMAVRDLGWMLYWVGTAQEALDTALLAWRVAEDPRVFLPAAISCDGSFLTHSQAIVNVPTQEQVDQFLPRYDRGRLLLHPDNPITVAPQVNEDWLMEIRRQTDDAMRRTGDVIKEAYEEFKQVFGRGDPSPFIEEYMTEDADIVLVGMGTSGHARPRCRPSDARAGQEGSGSFASSSSGPSPPTKSAKPSAVARPSASSTGTTPTARPPMAACCSTKSVPLFTTSTSARWCRVSSPAWEAAKFWCAMWKK